MGRIATWVAAAAAVAWAASHAGGHHDCVHDYIASAFADTEPPPASRQLYHMPEAGHGRRAQTVYAPIRITFDTTLLNANA